MAPIELFVPSYFFFALIWATFPLVKKTFNAETFGLSIKPVDIDAEFRRPKAILYAKSLIFGFCTITSIVIFLISAGFNLFHGYFYTPSSYVVTGGWRLLACIGLALSVTVPICYIFQVVLYKRVLGLPNRSCLLAFQPIENTLLFCASAFYILPLVEALRPAFFAAACPPEVLKFFATICGLTSIYVLTALLTITFLQTMCRAHRLDSMRLSELLRDQVFLNAPACPLLLDILIRFSSIGADLKGVRIADIINQIQFLNDQDFGLDLLGSKPDADIITLINVARFCQNYDKAELVSHYLFNRHAAIGAEELSVDSNMAS